MFIIFHLHFRLTIFRLFISPLSFSLYSNNKMPNPVPPPNPDSTTLSSPSQPSPKISFPRPPIRVTTEYDSTSSIFFNKVSCKLLDNLAKLKLSFFTTQKGDVSEPLLDLTSKYVSVHYDVEDQNAIIKANFDVGPKLRFRALHDVKMQQGELAMVASDSDYPGYSFQLLSCVPAISLPKVTVKFPLGELSLEEKESEEENKLLSINGLLKAQLLNGFCTARLEDDNLRLRYAYKDADMTFIPSVSLPSNEVSFDFKRRFNQANKLSYRYNFYSNDWSAVYKHTYDKDYKVKAGYDSSVRLGWASIWVGNESGKAKAAPMKMKVQFMVQVPQDDIGSPLLMFRVKKRWDI